MTTLLLLLILCADPPPDPKIDVFAYQKEGKDYVCFDLESARKLLQLRLDYPKLQQLLEESTKLIKNKDDQLFLITSSTKKIVDSFEIAVNQNIALQSTVKDLKSSKWIWATVSLIVGASAAFTTTYFIMKDKQ